MMTHSSIRAVFFQILEAESPKHRWAKPLRLILIAVILINVTVIILESVPDLKAKYAAIFKMIEMVSVTIFTLEYILRLWVAPEVDSIAAQHPLRCRIRYVGKPLALVDLFAILPFYLAPLLPLELQMLRILRLLQLLKLVRYFRGLSILAQVFRAEAVPMTAAMLVMLIFMVLAACGMYLAEHQVQPKTFGSIPAAMWWAIVTLTTVGYGDIVPVTLAGKIIGAVIMLLGIGMVALPAGMLASRFSEELHQRQQFYRLEVGKCLQDGKLTVAETADLEQLSDEWSISEADASNIIAEQQKSIQTRRFCPCCGQVLPTESSVFPPSLNGE
jgi:voltage-gated potassium channel